MDNIDILIKEYVSADKKIVSNLANISSILYSQMPDLNWLGFYIAENDREELHLGPFQGMPATTTISYSAGVCGACATKKETIIVDDVHCFAGHIACDIRSKSEIVVPVFDNDGNLYAVLDVDSPLKERFTKEDAQLLEKIASMITSLL